MAAPTRQLLYSIPDACDATSIGRSKMFELLASGQIESIKVGKRRLIPADALDAFVAGLRIPRSA